MYENVVWTPTLVESPFAGDVARNVRYARLAYHDCLVHRHEAPFASHLNYTQEGVLDDNVPEERMMGINAGLAIGALMERSAFYLDCGFSKGMRYGLDNALKAGRPIYFRRFDPDGWAETHSLDVDVLDAAAEFGLDDLIEPILRTRPELWADTLSPGCP